MTLDRSGRHDSFVLLGTVIRPHGIRGELKVRPWTEKPDNLCRYRRIYLATETDGPMLECTNVRARVSGDMIILRINECNDRNRAATLVGQHLWVPVSDLPPVEDDEFYLHALIGKRARTMTGQCLGTVRGVLSSAQDVLVIEDGTREYLVPALRHFIVARDETEIVLDLPPGLLEINR